MNKTVLITGGSSGIGRAAAEYLAGKGCRVYELSRRGGNFGNVTHITTDVTDENSVVRAVEQVMEAEGHIDVLINNAGYGISGAAEYTSVEEAQRQLDVNFWGMVRAVKAVVPYMRKQGGGRIVNTSSVAAPIPIPFQTYYSVSKAAINSFTMAVANELRPFGIRVCAVMPGDTSTGFTDARERSFAGDDVYAGRIRRSVSKMEKDERAGGSAAAAGAFLGRVALSDSGKVLYTIGVFYTLAAALVKLLPATAANRLIGLLYAR